MVAMVSRGGGGVAGERWLRWALRVGNVSKSVQVQRQRTLL